jgi:hypothetical protein
MMATAAAAPAKPADKPQKTDKPKKDPKPLYQRLDEQLTRAIVGKKITLEEAARLEARVTKLKALLEE